MTNKPTHYLMHIIPVQRIDEDQPERKIWTRIGVGWELPSGRINIIQNYYPIDDNGSLQLVAVKDLPSEQEIPV